jgi:solute carrier family 50 protein (sugar transporter)
LYNQTIIVTTKNTKKIIMSPFSDFLRIAAPAVTIAVFLAPITTVRHITTTQSTGELPAATFVSMSVNCAVWATYGLMKDDWTVMMPNILGTVISAYYLSVYETHTPKVGPRAAELRRTFAMGCLVLLVLLFEIMMDDQGIRASQFVGTCGAVLSVVFSSSPLFALPAVFRSRNPDSIPLPTAVMIFISCLLWASYGWFVAYDKSIWLPNTFGLFVATIQLLTHAVFALGIVTRGGVRVASL